MDEYLGWAMEAKLGHASPLVISTKKTEMMRRTTTQGMKVGEGAIIQRKEGSNLGE